jgi:D-alanyl-D-alanine carboxypeptidase (penicillin-binding protein 5/6)
MNPVCGEYRLPPFRMSACAAVVLSLCLWAAVAAAADEISARAAVVIDGWSGKILYAKNPHLKLPPASTTKLVTSMVALDRISPDAVVKISEHAANTPSVAPHLRKGERMTVTDLLYLALMRSVNGAAVALAEAVAGSEDAFVTMMNEKMQSLDADNTRFVNASGLPGGDQYITAHDLARVMKESLGYPLIREIINTRTAHLVTPDGRRIFLRSTNHLLWTDDDLIGGKTGYTRAARHCFVCAAEKGPSLLIAAVLGESGREGLWHASALLLAKGSEVLALRSEPTIYFSSINESRLIPASYTVEAPRKRAEKTKKKGISRERTKSKSKTSGRVEKGTRTAKAGKSVKAAPRTEGKKRTASALEEKTARKPYS